MLECSSGFGNQPRKPQVRVRGTVWPFASRAMVVMLNSEVEDWERWDWKVESQGARGGIFPGDDGFDGVLTVGVADEDVDVDWRRSWRAREESRLLQIFGARVCCGLRGLDMLIGGILFFALQSKWKFSKQVSQLEYLSCTEASSHVIWQNDPQMTVYDY